MLEAAGVPFRVVAPDVCEDVTHVTEPTEVARLLAVRKARAVARLEPDEPVLAADTIVVAANGERLGKPRDDSDATRMLRLHSGATQRVLTGVCLVVDGREHVDCDETLVTMRTLADDEIAAYVASGEPFGKAGGYAIQETGDRFVTSVEGSWSNVVGLPMDTVTSLFERAGLASNGAA